ncbi:hypothetical protein EXIGLDRAFT_727223 [Exidia glandulosa HHB12029]|uniref:Protein OS-9 homolog n=1 Tax=Exidia glandulosa HHB12029 TaxID=1314781 RepID=A0A165ZNM6_EXIGL|nr:hypothetical protein EXIGLDRAFT_727223 [Exidia glandulosa HHB12029]
MWLTVLALSATAAARFGGVQDVDAYPKYAVTFLNSLPVSNQTAESWLQHGLAGGEPEFLEVAPTPSLNRIESGDEQAGHPGSADTSQPQHVQHMRFGSAASYVCLIPPARALPHPSEELEPAPTPSKTWELLQPLSGKCLYHRQGWFTYSYCHGQHVRQFRELPDQPSVTFPPVAKVPEEDPEYPSYTLGKSAQAEDGSISEAANNLELARGTGQRYLHFRWGDGTVCDKTGKGRAVEVQFHCAMSVTDTIVFVKETRTCEYTLVIHTPRLCSEPGFRRVLDDIPPQAIRCREVLSADATAEGLKGIPSHVEEAITGVAQHAQQQPSSHPLFESSHPKQYKRRPYTRVPVRVHPPEVKGKEDPAADDANFALRRLLETILGSKLDLPPAGSKDAKDASNAAKDAPKAAGDKADAGAKTPTERQPDALPGALADLPVSNIRKRQLPNGEVVIEFAVDDDTYDALGGHEDDEYDDDWVDDVDADSEQSDLTIVDVLRAAGYDVRTLEGIGKKTKDGRAAQAEGDKETKQKQKLKKDKERHTEL